MPKKPVSQKEIKYILTPWQAKSLIYELHQHMKKDTSNNAPLRVYSLFYDALPVSTTKKILPRCSSQLVIRSDAPFKNDSTVTLELENFAPTCSAIMSLEEALNFIATCKVPQNPTCTSDEEIYNLWKFVCSHNLMPSLFMTCDRLSFFNVENPKMRIVIDSNVTVRRKDFFSDAQAESDHDGLYYMKLKPCGALPHWLSNLLSQLNISRVTSTRQAAPYYI